MFGLYFESRAALAGVWASGARVWGDETVRDGAVAVVDWGRFEPATEANWSREGVARSFGFRKVPPIAVVAVVARDSRDGDARIELERGTGSFDDGAGSLDNRGMPVVGLV